MGLSKLEVADWFLPGIPIIVNTAALKCFLWDLGKMDAPMELAVPLSIIFYKSRTRRGSVINH